MNEIFLKELIRKGEEARTKVNVEFMSCSPRQLNWKLASNKWSIADCLQHLILADRLYFNSLQKIVDGTYYMSFWARLSPLSSLWGKAMVSQLSEDVKLKMDAPDKIKPDSADKPFNILSDYKENLDKLLYYISECSNIDLDKTIIHSPTINFITYSLRNAFMFLLQHEHRHINQAIKIKQSSYFPLLKEDEQPIRNYPACLRHR